MQIVMNESCSIDIFWQNKPLHRKGFLQSWYVYLKLCFLSCKFNPVALGTRCANQLRNEDFTLSNYHANWPVFIQRLYQYSLCTIFSCSNRSDSRRLIRLLLRGDVGFEALSL